MFGVIYPPQVALVGFGRVLERPWASGGMLGVRPIVTRRSPQITGPAMGTPAPAC